MNVRVETFVSARFFSAQDVVNFPRKLLHFDHIYSIIIKIIDTLERNTRL